MTFQELNEKLRDLQKFRLSKDRISREVVKEIDDYGSQGDSGIAYEIYPTSDPEVFIKLTINTDSYGDEEFVGGIEFVQKITKEVTTWKS